jgi:hypothetical protein
MQSLCGLFILHKALVLLSANVTTLQGATDRLFISQRAPIRICHCKICLNHYKHTCSNLRISVRRSSAASAKSRRCSELLGLECFENVCERTSVEWVIRIRLVKKVNESCNGGKFIGIHTQPRTRFSLLTIDNSVDVKNWLPVLPKNVQAHITVHVNVGMIYLHFAQFT